MTIIRIVRTFDDIVAVPKTYSLSTKSGVLLDTTMKWIVRTKLNDIQVDSSILGTFADALGDGIIGEEETINDPLIFSPDSIFQWYLPYATPAADIHDVLSKLNVSSISQKANMPYGAFKSKLDLRLFVEPGQFSSATHDIELECTLLEFD